MKPSELLAVGSTWFIRWENGTGESEVVLEFARISEHTETVTAEVTVTSTLMGEVAWSRFNLLAGTARAQFVKACDALLPDVEWPVVVDQSCKAMIRALRKGLPPVALEATEPEPEWIKDRWLVPNLIPRKQITVLYADGGIGKSWLALAIAVAGLQGHALSTTWSVGTINRVLYLDWESSKEDHQERLWRLTAGREALKPGAILYHRLHRPLSELVDQLQREIHHEGIDFVTTDSLGAASGSEPESNDAALRTFSALRALDATHLVLAHVSKAHAEADGPRRPFGGVYVVNTARSTIEARRLDDAEDDRLLVTLHHRKTNVGRLAPPSALAFTWDRTTGYVSVSQAKPDLQSSSLSAQILDALRHGPETRSRLVEELGASDAAIRSALRRLENRAKVIPITRSVGGRGVETQWGRTDANRADAEP